MAEFPAISKESVRCVQLMWSGHKESAIFSALRKVFDIEKIDDCAVICGVYKNER